MFESKNCIHYHEKSEWRGREGMRYKTSSLSSPKAGKLLCSMPDWPSIFPFIWNLSQRPAMISKT